MSDLSHPQDILEIIAGSQSEIALIAVTRIFGGTLRAKGALMAVSPDNSFGYISAGCVDGDIIFQAREALAEQRSRRLVYGEGSPFKDIALPCGGSIEVLIIPSPDKAVINTVLTRLKARTTATLSLEEEALDYRPKLRFRIIGRGAPFEALANLVTTSGFEVIGQSPDAALGREDFIRFDHLTDPADTPPLTDDPWTAAVFLFHDHDWEPALMAQALTGAAFYIGAMGSERTQEARLAMLEASGVKSPSRIRGPIGMIPAMRDAQLLAVSILAEVITEAQTQNRL